MFHSMNVECTYFVSTHLILSLLLSLVIIFHLTLLIVDLLFQWWATTWLPLLPPRILVLLKLALNWWLFPYSWPTHAQSKCTYILLYAPHPERASACASSKMHGPDIQMSYNVQRITYVRSSLNRMGCPHVPPPAAPSPPWRVNGSSNWQ